MVSVSISVRPRVIHLHHTSSLPLLSVAIVSRYRRRSASAPLIVLTLHYISVTRTQLVYTLSWFGSPRLASSTRDLLFWVISSNLRNWLKAEHHTVGFKNNCLPMTGPSAWVDCFIAHNAAFRIFSYTGWANKHDHSAPVWPSQGLHNNQSIKAYRSDIALRDMLIGYFILYTNSLVFTQM